VTAYNGSMEEVSTTVGMGNRRVRQIAVWTFPAWTAFRPIRLPAKRGSVVFGKFMDLRTPDIERCEKRRLLQARSGTIAA
jgi:hypothetical protein